MNELITWFDIHNGFLTFIGTLSLISVTIYYAIQTSKQAKDSHRMVEETRKQIEREEELKHTSALNYLYLINGEIRSHENNYVAYLCFYRIIGNPYVNNPEKKLKHFSCSVWNDIKSETSKIFSNILMQEIIGYYLGVNLILNDDGTHWEELSKGQLVHMHKCFKIIESDFNIQLRGLETYIFNDTEYKIDKETGNIISLPKT